VIALQQKYVMSSATVSDLKSCHCNAMSKLFYSELLAKFPLFHGQFVSKFPY